MKGFPAEWSCPSPVVERIKSHFSLTNYKDIECVNRKHFWWGKTMTVIVWELKKNDLPLLLRKEKGNKTRKYVRKEGQNIQTNEYLMKSGNWNPTPYINTSPDSGGNPNTYCCTVLIKGIRSYLTFFFSFRFVCKYHNIIFWLRVIMWKFHPSPGLDLNISRPWQSND